MILAVGCTESRQPPNIVLILADDLGYGDVGAYNPESKIPTPHIDTLASEGIRFIDAHSPSSVCTPTRYGVLTGRYAWRTPLKTMGLYEWDRPLIQEDRLTMPHLLRSKGYRTACIGKWHLGWDWPLKPGTVLDLPNLGNGFMHRTEQANAIDFTEPIRGGPVDRGFDLYFGDDVANFPPYAFIENDRLLAQPTALPQGRWHGRPGPMVPGWDFHRVMPQITRRAVRFIEQQTPETRFFLYFSLTAPHYPIVPLPRFRGVSDAGRYGDFVHEVDWSVGEILEALRRRGLEEDTLVLFTSDNGATGNGAFAKPRSLAERTGHRANGQWRGVKGDIWEGGHRVPLIARWPGRIPEGEISSQLVGLNDLFATVAEIVDFRVPRGAGEDSTSFLPLLFEEPDPPGLRTELVLHSSRGAFALRSGNWKLIPGELGSGGRSPPIRRRPRRGEPRGQLYDLRADPTETRNLYYAHADEAEAMRARLLEIIGYEPMRLRRGRGGRRELPAEGLGLNG
ncbi:MAG: arylsulfatase [Candidatus Binatia bacterium]|nr:arylsulfatase [Candidatus Binatia bacterium]MDG2010697.1 arylsulfatase [Candidatus Binatia bacterium]